jgi:hypothetical protein
MLGNVPLYTAKRAFSESNTHPDGSEVSFGLTGLLLLTTHAEPAEPGPMLTLQPLELHEQVFVMSLQIVSLLVISNARFLR